MAKRVILHAGLPKTGTTALQEALYASRDRLGGIGYGYWSVCANHSVPLALMFNKDGKNQAWIDRRGVPLRREIGGPREFERRLVKEINETEDTFIISGEGVSMFPVSKLRKIDRIISETGAECIPLLYLREPKSHLVSSAQQRLKSGRSISTHLVKKNTAPDKWARALLETFGQARLRCRAYRGSGFLMDFYREVGITIDIPTVTANESFSHEAAMWLDAVNGVAEEQGGYTYSNAIRLSLQDLMPGPRFQLPPEVLDDFVTRNAERLDFLSGLLGEDIRALPSSVAPPPDVAPPDPRVARLIFELAKKAGDARIGRQQALEGVGEGPPQAGGIQKSAPRSNGAQSPRR